MADRWVCRSCWTANEEGWDRCIRCRTLRGAEPSQVPAAEAGAETGRSRWRRLPVQLAGVGIFGAAAVFGALNAATRDESGAITEAGALHIADVRVGDCFDLNEGPDIEEVGEVTAIPCNEPHTFEAYELVELDDGPYPSRSQLDAEIDAACLPAFERWVGRDYGTSALYITSFEPTPDGWDQGDRGVLCVVNTVDLEPMTGSVRDSGR